MVPSSEVDWTAPQPARRPKLHEVVVSDCTKLGPADTTPRRPAKQQDLPLLSQPATAVPERLLRSIHGRRALAGQVRLQNKLFDKALVHFEFDALVKLIDNPDPVIVPGVRWS